MTIIERMLWFALAVFALLAVSSTVLAPFMRTPCRDSVIVVQLDWTTERACARPEATLEPIATDHPGTLAYLCRCPTPAVEETP